MTQENGRIQPIICQTASVKETDAAAMLSPFVSGCLQTRAHRARTSVDQIGMT
jgi:hypothetical protein